VYDYLLTLHYEAKFIWPWKWDLGKFLYILTRYVAFVDITVFLVYWFDQSLSYTVRKHPVCLIVNSYLPSQACHPMISIGSWLLWAGVTIAECIISLRTYALFGRSKYIGIFLLVLNIGVQTTIVILLKSYLRKLEYVPSPFPTIITCFTGTTAPRSRLYPDYALIMTIELCIIVLTIWRGIAEWSNAQSSLFGTLYRDGVTFFVCLFAISFTNFLLNIITQSLLLEILLPEFQRVMHSVLTARVILHLRAAAEETKSGTVTSILFDPATMAKSQATIETRNIELEDFHSDNGTPEGVP